MLTKLFLESRFSKICMHCCYAYLVIIISFRILRKSIAITYLFLSFFLPLQCHFICSSPYLLGDAGDSMTQYHNNRRFTTYDADNDDWSSNCAQRYAGGWWYGTCHNVHLNGVYFYPYESKPATSLEIDWNSIENAKPLKKTEIKIRREE